MNKSKTHRERVYEVAQEYIFQRGAAGWNMEDLSRDSGITKRTLYKIIESKEKLVEEIVIAFIQSNQEKIAAIIEGERDFFMAAKSVMAEFPKLAGSMNSPSLRDIFIQYPDVEKRVVARRGELTAGMIAFFEKGIRAGHLRKDLTGEFVLQLFQAMVLYFIKTAGSDGEFSLQITTAFNVLFSGIRPEGSKGAK